MAISYPLNMPTNIGFAEIELRTRNTVAVSQSPFTYAQQVHSYGGEMWEAEVSLPPMNRDDAQAWVAFLMGLKGRTGTFLLSDPSAKAPLGTATSASISGSAGDSSVTITMTGTLKAGDYIQIGSASDATLHKVLEDKTNSGSIEIWPRLRKDRSTSCVLLNTAGLFRLNTNETSWSVNNASFYGISFGAVEAITDTGVVA